MSSHPPYNYQASSLLQPPTVFTQLQASHSFIKLHALSLRSSETMTDRITQLRKDNQLTQISVPQQSRFTVELQILYGTFLAFYLLLTVWNLCCRLHDFILLRRRRRAPKYLPTQPLQSCRLWQIFIRYLYLPAMFEHTHKDIVTFHELIPPVSLPLRGQAICMTIYFLLNIILGLLAYTTWIRPVYTPIFAAKQWGFFAFLNTIFLCLHAGRASPILWLTNMSYNDALFVHRWLGRLIFLESSIHSTMHFYLYIVDQGYTTTSLILGAVPFVSWGLVGCVTAALIVLHSWAPLRRLAYEFFHAVHIGLVVVFFVAMYMHAALGIFPLKYKALLYVAMITLLFEYCCRAITLLRCNIPWARMYGLDQRASTCCLAASSGTTRVTISTPGFASIRPGDYVYLSIPSLGLLQFHPFSVAWHENAVWSSTSTDLNNTLVLVAKKKEGFTRTIYHSAKAKSSDLLCYIDGPYGPRHDLDVYDEVLMVCGGIGITSALLRIKHHLDHLHTFPQQRLFIVWVVKSSKNLDWVEAELEHLFSEDSHSITFHIYITGATQSPLIEKHSLIFHSGRPDIPSIVQDAIINRFGTLCVLTCGPGNLTDSVRRTVCKAYNPAISFIEDSYSW